MLKNIATRRSTYKYMYSMYVDFSRKITETLNRPRFFYINLIEPKTYKYYKEITTIYGNLFVFKIHPYMYYTMLHLIKNQIFNKYISNNNKNSKLGKEK